MNSSHLKVSTAKRDAPLEVPADEFRKVGHRLVDQIAEFLDGLPERSVTKSESPQKLRELLGEDQLPEHGSPAGDLFNEVTDLLFDHSLFNGHPRFWGYITSSAAPIGALADLLASSINPNVGAAKLSPIASEIESQTIRWLADFIGYPRNCGGLLVSGGNMANFTGFLVARKIKAPWDPDKQGFSIDNKRPVVYVSKETHTWIDKASELFGLGAKSVRWIETNHKQQMDMKSLEQHIVSDLADNHLPFMVVGTAGTVGTGAIDPLPEIAAICKKYNLWFHVDGAYGAPAAVLPNASVQLKGLSEADSIALDPHKWLYNPMEAGCTLVRNPNHLIETFSHHPVYYNFDEIEEDSSINYHEFGLQNSRGFRALKVWLGLRQVGRQGYIQMLSDDIALSQHLFETISTYSELQAVSQNLSITTFRYVPQDLSNISNIEPYLNELNEELLNRLQSGGEAFVSNAVVDGKYLLRACIVNFRTTISDVEFLPQIVVRLGKELDSSMRPIELQAQ